MKKYFLINFIISLITVVSYGQYNVLPILTDTFTNQTLKNLSLVYFYDDKKNTSLQLNFTDMLPKTNTGKGAFIGFVTGSALGGAMGYYTYLVSDPSGNSISLSPQIEVLSGILIGGILGALFGGAIGSNKKE